MKKNICFTCFEKIENGDEDAEKHCKECNLLNKKQQSKKFQKILNKNGIRIE